MSIRKYFRTISLSAALLIGCQDAQSVVALDSIRQNGMGGNGYTDANNLLVHGVTLQVDPASFEPTILLTEITRDPLLKGVVHYANLITPTGKAHVLIDDMSYKGPSGSEKVAELRTKDGWLVWLDDQGKDSIIGADSSLVFHLSAPYNYNVQIKFAADAGLYAKYSISYLDPAIGVWSPACSLYGGIETSMIPVGGFVWDDTTALRTVDPNAITLSCTHDAIGGPILWGYDIWKYPQYHQAASRMKRLDLCGDGHSITYRNHGIEGSTTIAIFDDIVIHKSAGQSPSAVEAYWKEDGAICVNPTQARDPRLETAIQQQLLHCPKPLCSAINYTAISLPLGSSKP